MLFVRANERVHELVFVLPRKPRVYAEREFEFFETLVKRVGGVWNIELRMILEGEKVVDMFHDTRAGRA